MSQNGCIPPSAKMAVSLHQPKWLHPFIHPDNTHPPLFFSSSFFLSLSHLFLLKLSFSFLPDAACTDTQHQKADKGVATPATQTIPDFAASRSTVSSFVTHGKHRHQARSESSSLHYNLQSDMRFLPYMTEPLIDRLGSHGNRTPVASQ